MQDGWSVDGNAPGSREALIERVASSSALQKSNRLRELFLFLCERALADPDAVIRESEIGIEVFGRQPGYDTGQDPLVRVQVSQLRKKLQQYYESEGQEDLVVIEIPKGAYTPVFRVRRAEFGHPAEEEKHKEGWWNRRRLLAAGLLAAIAVLGGIWTLGPGRRGERLRPVAESGPLVDRMWRDMFSNGRPSCVVLSDVSLSQFQNIIGRTLTLNEYRNKDFELLVREVEPDPDKRMQARLIWLAPFTHTADAQLAGVFSVLNNSQRIPTDIVLTREFGPAYMSSHNIVLLGSRFANPWVDFFETQLNFRAVHQVANPPVAYLENRSPRNGEQARYDEDWGKAGYCHLAYLPNLTHGGNTLLISGTHMAATEAGGAFMTSERWVEKLRAALGMGRSERFPFFEAVLRVEYVAQNSGPGFRLVAQRRLKL